MMCILTIGYYRILLPNETGVHTIMKALANASEIKEDKRYEGGGIATTGERIKVGVEMLPGYRFVKRRADQPLEPEVLAPERPATSRGILPPSHARTLPASHRRFLPPDQLRLPMPGAREEETCNEC